MTPSLKLEDAAPVTTAAEARDRVADLIGPALVRTLWFMLLDRHGMQVPVLIPLENLPLRPAAGDLALFAGSLGELLDEHAPGGSLILTVERPGSAALTAADHHWAAELHTAFGPARVTGVFLAHDCGVVELSP